MKLLNSSFYVQSQRASITKTFLSGKDLIKVGHREFLLQGDIETVKKLSETDSMTGSRMFLIIILAITVIGLILAIPLYFAAKKKRITVGMKTVRGETFVVTTDSNKETETIKKYVGMGCF